jgi:hypothetical protein
VLDFDGDGEGDVFQNANGDILVNVGSLRIIATNVEIKMAFRIPRGGSHSVGAFLLWDATGNGRPDGGAILIDRNRDGDFGEPREIQVFGRD